MRNVVKAAAFAVALGASALSPAYAETSGHAGPGMGMMGGGCPMMSMMGQGKMDHGKMDRGKMGAMAAGRLAYLKSKLNITDAQADAWNGYADAVNGRVDKMSEMRQHMMGKMRTGSATERMDARIAGMEAMLESMKTVNPAIQSLYMVLTDEQKKIADQLIGMDCGGM